MEIGDQDCRGMDMASLGRRCHGQLRTARLGLVNGNEEVEMQMLMFRHDGDGDGGMQFIRGQGAFMSYWTRQEPYDFSLWWSRPHCLVQLGVEALHAQIPPIRHSDG